MASLTTTPTPEAQAEQLRQQMRQIRRDLGDDVEELVENAERLMDWRYYVRRYPWFTIGVAAFVGYYMVPARSVALPTDENTLARLAEKMPVVAQQPEPKRTTLLATLIGLAMPLVTRAAVNYGSQYLGKMMNSPATEPQPHPAEAHHD